MKRIGRKPNPLLLFAAAGVMLAIVWWFTELLLWLR